MPRGRVSRLVMSSLVGRMSASLADPEVVCATARHRNSPYAGKKWCPRDGSNSRHQETRGKRDGPSLLVCEGAARSKVLGRCGDELWSGVMGPWEGVSSASRRQSRLDLSAAAVLLSGGLLLRGRIRSIVPFRRRRGTFRGSPGSYARALTWTIMECGPMNRFQPGGGLTSASETKDW